MDCFVSFDYVGSEILVIETMTADGGGWLICLWFWTHNIGHLEKSKLFLHS